MRQYQPPQSLRRGAGRRVRRLVLPLDLAPPRGEQSFKLVGDVVVADEDRGLVRAHPLDQLVGLANPAVVGIEECAYGCDGDGEQRQDGDGPRVHHAPVMRR